MFDYYADYAEFLKLPESRRYEILTGFKMNWWQKLWIKFLCKWWTYIRNIDPTIRAIDLWESLYNERFLRG